ncbi:hypothetical protein HA402_004237 [Bradysia odoriphaga]|nr:hypothetical protein HA402_004237 [Bradysia odoriphaga]
MWTTGVTANVQSEQCVITEKDKTESIASWAQKAGKATGLVTTTTVTHASPSGVYANTPSRFWEGNKALDSMCGSTTNVRDIAYQLINGEVGKKLKVILGGGRAHMINSTMKDEEGQFGQRTDGRNLINEWLAAKNQVNVGQFVWHKQQLGEVNYNTVDYLLGLFESLDCLYQMDINDGNLHNQEPTLTDMTVAAIRMLEKDPNGYFLFVESGKIDHAHHYNQANRAMVETAEFIRTIETARAMTNDDDTLIVITSDHSHTFTYSGYGQRKSDALGFGGISDMDQKPYLKFSYANGPAYDTTYIKNTAERVDLTNVDIHSHSFLQSATVPLSAETHAADDVGIFASGPIRTFVRWKL